MRVLILGGTGFLGRHIAERALRGGHALTLFHRGHSNPGIHPDAEHILGDRTVSLGPLRGRPFDVVFDTSGYEVAPVRAAARALAHPGVHYVFVSSISVYADLSRADESGPVRTVEDAENATLAPGNYGALKAACERALDDELPGNTHHVRAGLILGPHDYDLRFRYWLERIALGGDVLAPGAPDAPAQYIDVRDLTDWMLRCAEARRTGVDNATGEPIAMCSLLETIRTALDANASFHWVPDAVLEAHDVAPYSEMPFWLPASLGARPVNIERARGAGLAFRPLVETVRDTWAWLREGWEAETSVRDNRRFRVPGGMEAAREQAILAAWGR